MSMSMLPANDAEALILRTIQPLNAEQDAESVDLASAHGRILAAAVKSTLDFPHWTNSAMDGYAVQFEDVRDCRVDRPVTLTLVEEIPAGYAPQLSIQSGQAARIFTGAIVPDGADTIVIQENTRREGDRVVVLSAPKFQDFVRHQGEFYRAGDVLLTPGIRLSAPDIAVLAAAQCTQVSVYRRPRVAILSTGNELVAPGQPLQPGQIVDSNQYALAALVAASGAIPLPLGIVSDQPDQLKRAIAQAVAQADIVLSSGGVSVGDYDYVDRILEELGAEIQVRSVAVKPGKPLTVATIPRLQAAGSESASKPASAVTYFGLPGNPVSALVSFWRFVQPGLRKFSGLSESWSPRFLTAVSSQDLKAGGARETYLWGRLDSVSGHLEFRLAGGSHSSGNLINLSQTNALAIVPIGTTLIPAGTPLQVMSLSDSSLI